MRMGRLALGILALHFATSISWGDDHTFKRAGNSTKTAWWAHPSPTRRYVGYYVGGGGGVHPGEMRRPDEGVWGQDYRGGWFKRRVMIPWNHGQRYQGGIGAYKTDGPKVPVVGPIRRL